MPRLSPSIVLRLLCGLALCGLASIRAAPVTPARIETLAESDRAAWRDYLARSESLATRDREATEAELRANKLAAALAAPSGGDFKLPGKVSPDWYASASTLKLVDIVLSYQTPSGGWSKHTGYSRGPRQPGMLFTSQNEPAKPAHYLATFDNGSTTEQLWLLARVWRATGREDCKAAFLRGLDYVFAAQFPNGGWPQVYPLEGGYHDDITLNDDAFTHILELLQAIRDEDPAFGFLDSAVRGRVLSALDAGLDRLLRLQLVIDGAKTGWCQQYDAVTSLPSPARKFEPTSLCSLESAGVLKFLMTIRRPSPEIVDAVEKGLDWLERVKLTDVAKRTADGRTTYVIDPKSTETYWARFYDISTGRPMFPGRDGVVYETYEAMIAKNKAGYDYYTTHPRGLLQNGRKKWEKLLAAAKAS